MHPLVHAERIQQRRAAGAEQVEVIEVLLHQQAPGDLEAQRGAAFEAQEGGGAVLHLALLLAVDAGRHRLHLGSAQHPEGQIQHLEAEVEHHAAARLALLRPPLVGVPLRPQPEPAGLGVEDLAEIALVDEPAQQLGVGAEAMRHRAHQDAIGLARGFDHRPCLLRAARERALAQHVLAGFERRRRHRGMQEVRRADVDRVDVLVVEEIVQTARRGRHVELLRHASRLLAVAIAQCDQLHVLDALEHGDVADLGGGSDAHQRDPQRLTRHAHSSLKRDGAAV